MDLRPTTAAVMVESNRSYYTESNFYAKSNYYTELTRLPVATFPIDAAGENRPHPPILATGYAELMRLAM
jgi:hypothetical protein